MKVGLKNTLKYISCWNPSSIWQVTVNIYLFIFLLGERIELRIIAQNCGDKVFSQNVQMKIFCWFNKWDLCEKVNLCIYCIFYRYAWRESPCPNGIENCAIYSANSTTNTLALPAPPFVFDNSVWNYVNWFQCGNIFFHETKKIKYNFFM